MAVNKIEINGNVELDLTADTITAETLLSGITAHDKTGNLLTGSLQVQTVRTGTGEPASSLGNNGDLYLVLEE